MSLSRRTFLGRTLSASLVLALGERASALSAASGISQQPILRRPIPRSGEMLPIIGLGSVGTFNLRPGDTEYDDGVEVMRLFAELGGRVIDTAPGYQNSELFVGETMQRLGVSEQIFLATKFNAIQISAGSRVRAGGTVGDNQEEMERQMTESLRLSGRRALDLQQVWNLGDTQMNAQRSSTPAGYLRQHLEKAIEWKEAGRTRYIGITTSRDPQYGEVEEAMADYPIDFVQLDFSIEDPLPEERLLPAAADNGVAVLINRPFGSGSLFRLASQRQKVIPPWAEELGIDTWGKYFLKYIVSHPAVTAVIPATGNPRNLRDNMGAGVGELPDAATRRRMVAYWRE